ncbi:alkaline phosphatase family protein [Ensifer aridi]|uniref:alkaline phosphatase family protein n=1 Tax=Ensifer aridi TaxID=1708715 RepID=UPI0003F52CEE|nr:alkaline phosphatase family protein [Ensifer aridi]
MQFLIIGFDGLRSELVTKEAMPNLWRLQGGGTRFARHRPVFPSETVVNLSSLVTGSRPTQHGIMGNSFSDPNLTTRHPFNGFDVSHIELANRVYPTGLFTTPSLGEILGKAGKRMAVISTLYPGIARIKHHNVLNYADKGHISFSCYSFDASWPPSFASAAVDRLGPPPIRKVPDRKVIRYATEAFFEMIRQTGLPDVSFLWFVEPDDSCHLYGLGSEEVRQALKLVDDQLGRLLDWWQSGPHRETLQIIVTSDHGQITQTNPWSIHEYLQSAGFRVSASLDENCDCSVVPGYHGSIRLKRQDEGLHRAMAQALMSAEQIGLLFSRPDERTGQPLIDGTIATDFVGFEHARGSDLDYVLRTSDSSSANGYWGECTFEVAQGVPAGGTIHGGLHPAELSAFCAISGSAVRQGHVSDIPSGIVDIARTVVHALGIAPPITMDGRVLHEAFSSDDQPSFDMISDAVTTTWGSYRQTVNRVHYGPSIYMDGGTRHV